MLLCAFVTCLKKMHNILKCLWGFHVFYKIKPENQGCMMSLAGVICSKIYNTVLLVFGYFNKTILHIVALTLVNVLTNMNKQ